MLRRKRVFGLGAEPGGLLRDQRLADYASLKYSNLLTSWAHRPRVLLPSIQ